MSVLGINAFPVAVLNLKTDGYNTLIHMIVDHI